MPKTTRPSVLASRPSSVEKAIDILLCFAPQHPQLRLTDISQRLGLHMSTTHRLLSLLKKKRLITADAASQLYSLGPGIVELAWIILRQQDLRTVCAPYLERLRQATNETVSLYIRMGDCRVCIEELESGQEIKYSQTVGLTAPLHVGAPGKVLLAFLPPAELEVVLATLPLIAVTSQTITNREQLLEELNTVRQRGYAVSVGERSLWASAAAAPIWDWSGKPIAALIELCSNIWKYAWDGKACILSASLLLATSSPLSHAADAGSGRSVSPWAGRRTSAVDCLIDRAQSSTYDWLDSGDSVKTTCTGQEGLCTCWVSDTRRKGHE